jgi:phosphomannomutase
MTAIKFGTDGWRAIIAQEYTVDNVMRVAEGTGRWMLSKGMQQVVVGHDTRFGGKLFAETTARVFGALGIKVLLGSDYVSTPMVSLAAAKTSSGLGVVITASHNPPSYNGFKLKSHLGGPLSPAEITEVEDLIPNHCTLNLPEPEALQQQGLLEYIDMEQMYLDHVRANFDLDMIHKAGITMAYDAMYGAGQRVMQTLFPEAHLLHCAYNPSFMGQAPEPIHRNLSELSSLIAQTPGIALGIANDGDADRIGMYDQDGHFVDSHHILLLLLLYMHRYKGLNGQVVVTFSVTDKMKKMADIFGLPCSVTKIGFKYIAEIMSKEDVLVGGEESGGLAVKGHIPERDGVWIGLMILEFMARTGKSLKALIQEVYDIVGPFASDRYDLHLKESQKQDIIAACKANAYTAFGAYTVSSVEDLDGFKFNLGEERWVMIRPSGTEPVLRVYAQAADHKAVLDILDAAKKTLLGQ